MSNISMSKDRKTTKKVILYLLNNLGDKTEGKKKIMKLMFLLEHYDLSSKKLTPKQLLGNDFHIYYYGVFSQDVMNTVGGLITDNQIEDGFPLKSSRSYKPTMDKDLKERIDTIIRLFGNYSGYQLEIMTLDMLGIKPHEKSQYFGQDISSILKKTKTPN